MIHICIRMNKSRAAFYKQKNTEAKQGLQSHIVQELVMEQRIDMPRLGGKKLYSLIHSSLHEHNIAMGRDKLFKWLKKQDLLVHPKKQYTKTTNSHHHFRKHENLIKDMPIERPDQVWVSDITYIRLQKGFCYLALVTDAYSRKIIGHHLNTTLELNGCLKAIEMACKHRIMKNDTIHHSDRGIQYCSNQYVEKLKVNNIRISMGEVGNCYDNAMAERVNGILKGEFNLDATFKDLEHAKKASDQAIKIYNERRPHWAIGLRKPIELYAA